MTIPDEAVQAFKYAMHSNVHYGYDEAVSFAITAALPFLQGMKVNDLSALERLAKLADDYDLPDENGPFPDIQDVMVTLGDLRKARKLFSELSAIEIPTTSKMEAVAPSPRAQALEEAAQWHESEAEAYDAEEGGPDVTGRMLAQEHRVSAIAIRALSSQPVADGLPQDVINLVIAARDAFDAISGCGIGAEIEADLDSALKPFSSRVPYDNEPVTLPASPGASE